MNVLITGATGFIGSHLVRRLVAEGHHCRCLVRRSSRLDLLRELGVELAYGDLTIPESLNGLVQGIELVYHLAAMGHVAAMSNEAYENFTRVNVEGTRILAEAYRSSSLHKFIHFSSTAAMGLIELPVVDETVSCQPKTPYQKSKRDSEVVALQYWEDHHLPVVVLRPSMVYGPGGSGEFLKFCRLMDRGFFPRVGWGKNLTPIVHVGDVVEAALLAAERGVPGQVYLVTSRESHEFTEIRNLVVKCLGGRRLYPYVPVFMAKLIVYVIEKTARLRRATPLVTRQNIESTITDRVFSVAKAERELGYIPRVSLDQGIKETISWYRQNGWL